MIPYKKWNVKYTAVFLSLAALALFSRFWILGGAAFRADEVDFYQFAVMDASIVDLWKDPPWLDQIPLCRSLSMLMVKIGLPPTPFVTRLPFALIGLLTFFIVWRFSRRLFGSGATLFVLTLALFNPYALYHARGAYYYSGAICFSAVMFWAFWMIKERLRKKEQPGRNLWTFWFAAAALACHMHMSVWIVTGLQALLLLIFGLRAFLKKSEKRRRFLVPFLAGCILLGLVMSRWIYRAVQAVLLHTAEGNYLVGDSAKKEFLRLLPAYFAGENIAAIFLLLIFAALTVRALFGGSGCTRRLRSLAWICALHIAVIMLYVAIVGGGTGKITYFSGVWVQFILLMGAGAYVGVRALSRKNRVLRAVLRALLAAGYILLTAVPDWAIIRLEGKPTPYYKINDWVWNNLPRGTLILTDRWWEPWAELKMHTDQPIYYTFTVPDEPLDFYRKYNWRKASEEFFEKFPSSAFLELTRGKYEKEFGKWSFPQSYFARSVMFTNEPALVLHRWKVLDFADPYTNRVITRIYYNTTEDLIAAARKAGRDTLLLYGPEWGYIKPGWEQGDFVDCRIMGESASVDLYNFKSGSYGGFLEISAVAMGQAKIVSMNGESVQFPPGEVWCVTIPLTLQPGKNTIPFTSPTAGSLFILDLHWTTETP